MSCGLIVDEDEEFGSVAKGWRSTRWHSTEYWPRALAQQVVSSTTGTVAEPIEQMPRAICSKTRTLYFGWTWNHLEAGLSREGIYSLLNSIRVSTRGGVTNSSDAEEEIIKSSSSPMVAVKKRE